MEKDIHIKNKKNKNTFKCYSAGVIKLEKLI